MDNRSDGSFGSDREQYTAVHWELSPAKQELRKLREEYDFSKQEKAAAIHQAVEAEITVEANKKRANELVKEIAGVHESIEEVKLEIVHAREEETKLYADKDAEKQTFRAKLEESTNKLRTLKKDIDPQST
ncbi:OLC1v1015894C1 [Oldenlandia corymbosa var. corymbosa]|uniref:OLC1v1015894C1 n=1 Tax=Oldenlandia corymbosa var. corymbosa TaxID=529605 RepID=A0AAV1E712_OLDCO|nr:OLC1v1015894C1 [Oldenlandia corymbosa var. corymbosa]